MPKIISHARQLRYELQAKLGREVTIEEVAGAIAVDRRVVMRIERNDMQLLNRSHIESLAKYYQAQGLDGTRVLQISPEDIIRTGLEGALVPAL